MKRRTRSLVLAALAAAATPAAAAPLEPVIVGVPGNAIGFAPWFIGKDAGIFAKDGLEVSFAMLAGNALPAALLSNGIQATPLLSEVVNAYFAGYKVKAVAVILAKSSFELAARAPIVSVRDLKGKAIVSSPPKGLPNVLARYVLATHGLDPDKDAKLLYIGSEEARRTIITSGQADAIVEDIAHVPALQERMPSLKVIFPADDMPTQSTGAGLGVSEEMLEKHPDLVKRMLRGLIDTMRFMKTHRPETAAFLAQEIKIPLPIAKTVTDELDRELYEPLVPSQLLFDTDAKVLAIDWGEHVAPAKFASAFDTRLAVDVMKERGGKE